jgi:hypothetical protein
MNAESDSDGLGPEAEPPRFLIDVDFNWRIIAGLRRRQPRVDAVTAQDLGLRRAPEPELLVYAMRHDRILLKHGVNTMPNHFYALRQSLREGEHSPGVMAIPQLLPIGAAIDALLHMWSCSAHVKWCVRFEFPPL